MTADEQLRYLNRMKGLITSDESLTSFLEIPEHKDIVEKVRQHYNKVNGINYFKGPLQFHIKVQPSGNYSFTYESRDTSHSYSSARFSLQLQSPDQRNVIPIVTFEITQYPYCCGMRQMNGFSYKSPISVMNACMEELVPMFTSICVDAYMKILEIQEKRLMINFVEYRKGDFSSMEDVPVVDAPYMQYSLFHEWAKKQKKYRASLMYNRNSSNIIHHAEVVVV